MSFNGGVKCPGSPFLACGTVRRGSGPDRRRGLMPPLAGNGEGKHWESCLLDSVVFCAEREDHSLGQNAEVEL